MSYRSLARFSSAAWAGLVGDTFPIRHSGDGAPGAFTLSRQSLEHMSSHDQKTLVGPPEWLTCGFGSHSVTERLWLQDEAMIVARRQLHMLQQANDGLRSDLVRAPLSPARVALPTAPITRAAAGRRGGRRSSRE